MLQSCTTLACPPGSHKQRRIRVLIVVSEVEIVFDERSADVRVVADAVAMDDGIYQPKRAQEKDHQNSCIATRMIHRGRSCIAMRGSHGSSLTSARRSCPGFPGCLSLTSTYS